MQRDGTAPSPLSSLKALIPVLISLVPVAQYLRDCDHVMEPRRRRGGVGGGTSNPRSAESGTSSETDAREAEQAVGDRNGDAAEKHFTDMLQQLRVVQTGVQILSAFLLTLPFTERFSHLDTVGTSLYTVSLVAAAVSTALLIAPVSYRQRVGDRALANVVKVASRLAQAGMLALMVAAVGAVTLATRVALGSSWSIALGSAVAVVYLASWYLLPAWHRAGEDRRAEPIDR